MNQPTLTAASLFALCASFGAAASAQPPSEPSVEPSAPPATTRPDPDPANTGAPNPEPTETAPDGFSASAMPLDAKLFLPVVGPWLDLTKRDCDVNRCGNDTFDKVLLAGDGALQGIGALSMALDLVVPESTKKPWYLVGDEKLSIAPQVGLSVTGLSATGQF